MSDTPPNRSAKDPNVPLESDNAQLSLLKSIWNASPFGIILITPGKDESQPVIIGDCNPVICQSHGYSHEELIGQSMDILQAIPWTQTVGLSWFEGLKDNGIITGESLHRRKDNSTFLIEYKISPITIDGVSCAVGFDRLLQNETQEEDSLHKIANRWINAMESSDEGIWDLDVSKRLLWTSPRWQTILGHPPLPKEYPLDDFLESIHPDDRIVLVEKLRQVISLQEKRLNTDLRHLNSENQWVWLLLRGKVAHSPDGKANRLLGSMTDITERKLAEKALLTAREKAESANRAKSQFLAVMSHEIRTPMNGVLGMASLLSETRLTPEQRSYLRTIESSGESLLSVIDEILSFSKLEAGNVEIEKQPFNLGESLIKAFRIISPLAGKKNLELILSLDPSLPKTLIGDETKIHQVLVNLIGNAVKFTEQGEIEISVKTEPLPDESYAENETRVSIAIRDTGIGIAPESLDKLFEPFAQADASTTRRYGGTGLGLAISRRMLQLMGGDIEIQSQIGLGSTFLCSVILEKADPLPVLSPSPSFQHKRVLLIQKPGAASQSLLATLQAIGFQPSLLPSNQDPVNHLQENPAFDCAIIDCSPQFPSGLERAKTIKQDFARYRLPLIGLSSIGDSAPNRSGIFAAVLTKPICPADLTIALETAFQKIGGHPDAPKPSAELQLQLEPSARAESVLLVEDNNVNRIVATQLLKKFGYHADYAENGFHALDCCLEKDYDLIFMDVQMPGMNGFETLEKIRSRIPQNRSQPWVIALTADAMPGDRERCFEAGMDDYLSKPIRPANLQAALQRASEEIAKRS